MTLAFISILLPGYFKLSNAALVSGSLHSVHNAAQAVVSSPNAPPVSETTDMGFPENKAIKALQVARNDVSVATDILTQFS